MSPGQLTELEEARHAVLASAGALETEPVPLAEAIGRVLSESAVSRVPVPGFDNSAMDGYAVRAIDTRGARPESPVALTVAGESQAGRPSQVELAPGEAIEISTGAKIPIGADAVVRVESTRPQGDRVLIATAVEPGKDIRRTGEDIAAGDTVIPRGTRIGPAELGVLVSIGLPTVPCRRRPRLRLITSGDELVEPGDPMPPGAVRNSNRFAIAALAERAGAEIVGQETVPDDPDLTRDAIRSALDADIVVICGGISAGNHDHVKPALAELGVEQVFWGLALKPGKPTWFGLRNRTLVFGLPGNPVAAIVTFLLLARPAILGLSGISPGRYRAIALMGEDFEKKPGHTHAISCQLELGNDGWYAWPAPKQGSHILTSLVGAHCLALLPTMHGSYSEGDAVEVELLDLSEPLDEPF